MSSLAFAAAAIVPLALQHAMQRLDDLPPSAVTLLVVLAGFVTGVLLAKTGPRSTRRSDDLRCDLCARPFADNRRGFLCGKSSADSVAPFVCVEPRESYVLTGLQDDGK